MNMVKLWILGMLAHMGMLAILNSNRGEVNAPASAPAPAPAPEAKFTQADMDRVVQERVGRERGKYAGYDELVKFKETHSKEAEAATQKALEESGKYEEAKKVFGEKEVNYNKAIAEGKAKITNLQISHALNAEIAAQNAYPEVADAMRGIIKISEDGTPYTMGKDDVGNDKNVPLKESVEAFLKARPHLVKANQAPGGGSPPGGGNTPAPGSETLDDLNKQLIVAMNQGNVKLTGELKAKINATFAAKGISRSM